MPNLMHVMFRMTYLRSDIDCRVALLFTRYKTSKGIKFEIDRTILTYLN